MHLSLHAMRLFACLVTILSAESASGADLVLSGGSAPSETTTVGTPAGGTFSANSSAMLLLNFGENFFNFGTFALGYEVPVALGGPGRALVATRGLTTENYAEQANFLATPGARLHVLPAARFTPWVSFGAGFGRVDRAGSLSTPTGSGTLAVASQTGPRNIFVISTAGGVDWKPKRFLLIRGEVRNYTFTTPQTAFVGSDAFVGQRRNNLMFLGGIGVRF
jgi:hypothetical protein